MGNIVYEKSFEFAVKIVAETKKLTFKRQYELSNQLLRCGTSIGANIAESEQAQSKADFISKLSIALKEAAETQYWLKLLSRSGDISEDISKQLLIDVKEIISILTASIKTSKKT